MASVKVVPKWNKKRKNGEVPLYLRIIKDRKAKFISLGYSINPNYWDKSNNCVKRSHPNSARLNSYLTNKIVEATNIVLQAETENAMVNLTKLKSKVTGKNQVSFISYFKHYLLTLEKKNKISSYKKGKSIKDKIELYIHGSDLNFKEIDVVWLQKYQHYLSTELGNKTNTIHSNLKLIRKLFNDAIREGVIPKELYPFDKFKLSWEKNSDIDHLKEGDLDKLKNLMLQRGTISELARNIFIFSCYTGGLRISDLMTLKWKNFDGNKINFLSYKTKETIKLPVPRVGKEILSVYHQGEFSKMREEYIFPILSGVPFDTEKQKQLAFSRKTAIINKALKQIAKKAGLEQQNISSHWARRTFACMALDKGLTLDIVSKLLGHSGEHITVESYAEYSDKIISNAMSKFD